MLIAIVGTWVLLLEQVKTYEIRIRLLLGSPAKIVKTACFVGPKDLVNNPRR